MVLMLHNRANTFPRWRGLTHFKQVVGITFNDGSKFEDISKVNGNIGTRDMYNHH